MRKLDKTASRSNTRRLSTCSAQRVPKWVILTPPQQAKDIPGMNMATGAKHGAFGPTNKENVIETEKHEYLTHPSKIIKRPVFARKSEKGKTHQPQKDVAPPSPPSESGHPPMLRNRLSQSSVILGLSLRTSSTLN